MPIERRDAGLVILYCVLTCGFYLIYWYAKMYAELEQVGGRTPTGHSYWVDLLLVVVTCTFYGIWVDYKMSQQFNELNAQAGLPTQDTTSMVVMLDIAAWVFGGMTNLVSSAIHQDQLNKYVRFQNERGAQVGYALPPTT
ncbi:MAG: DUF4234 domain-containing protein [Deltaproteobacteria bacterium]|nr:DUF4234 domain-containing protein [Deltaproteobacteria bacterium]